MSHQSVPDPDEMATLAVLVVRGDVVRWEAVTVPATTVLGKQADVLDMALYAAGLVGDFDLVVAGDYLGEMELAARKRVKGHSSMMRLALAVFAGVTVGGPAGYAREMAVAATKAAGTVGKGWLLRVAMVGHDLKHVQPVRIYGPNVERIQQNATTGGEIVGVLLNPGFKPLPGSKKRK